ncbi:hypothetical protein H0H87_005598 [Tephrocybe sp. NHM501043]|nr:hypothetical protein H0H87_005598 [Tephrocybe sp. NHM501043]
MNVLIYAGSEALQTSVAHSLRSMRSILLPQYSIQTITTQTLNTQPWKASCALFVLPQCHKSLPPTSSAAIRDYVEAGGSLLGLGAGAICSERELTGAVNISKNLLVGFLDRPTGTYVYITHGKDKELIDSSVSLQVSDGESLEGISGRGSGEFFGFDIEKDRSVLARFSDGDAKGSIAGLKRDIGLGRIAVWASNIEVPLTRDASTVLSSATTARETTDEEKRRLQLLRLTLLSLSLKLPSTEEPHVSRPLPQFLTSNPSKPYIVSKIADLVADPSPGSQLSIFKDDNDTFHFHNSAESNDLLKRARQSTDVSEDPSKWQPKHIILCSISLPDRDRTPLFDLQAYYESLSSARKAQGCPEVPDAWGCGEAFLYGEAVTSTQTMIDKYVELDHLEIFSLSTFPASKLVFVQYLFALAVVEACRDEAVLGKWGEQARLKWPNDIYAVVDGERKKIGCGLNVLNAAPIFSLAQLLSPEERKSLTLENTVSHILARFEKMWDEFIKERGSFDSFMNLYLIRWLHSLVH